MRRDVSTTSAKPSKLAPLLLIVIVIILIIIIIIISFSFRKMALAF